jgi:hypothetical protein
MSGEAEQKGVTQLVGSDGRPCLTSFRQQVFIGMHCRIGNRASALADSEIT